MLENLSAREDLMDALRQDRRPREAHSQNRNPFRETQGSRLASGFLVLRRKTPRRHVGSFTRRLSCLFGREMDDFRDLRDYLEKALVEAPPVFAREGGVIREGFSPELDRLRKIQSDGRKWISELEGRERKRTGIN